MTDLTSLGTVVYLNLQELVHAKVKLTKAELKAPLAIYKNDPSRLELQAQLPLLKPLCKEVCEELADNFSVHDAVGILSKLSAAERTSFSVAWSATVVGFTSNKCHLRAVILSVERGEDLYESYHDPGTPQQF